MAVALNGGRRDGPQFEGRPVRLRARSRAVLMQQVFATMIASGIILLVSAGTASAGAYETFAPLINSALVLIAVGITGLLFAGLFAFFKMEKVAIPVGIVSGVVVLAGVAGGRPRRGPAAAPA